MANRQPQQNLFKISTFNCNGLGNPKKRKDVFDFIRKKDWNIIFLQESHLLSSDEKFIRSCWGYEVIVCGNEHNKNGVTILFNNNFEFKLLEVEKDPNGCYIMVGIEFLKRKYTIVNLYGPSSGDNPDFFNKIFDRIDQFDREFTIVAGDWNCYLDKNLDVRNYASTPSRQKTRKRINEFIANNNMYDVFRELYPDKRQYTWRRFNSVKQSRLDYFLVSETLLNDVFDVKVEPGYRSDHSFVILSINKSEFLRDRPFYKFNNSLLRDEIYVREIKKTNF
jgi:exonuclease III